jgi:hypothetical protein
MESSCSLFWAPNAPELNSVLNCKILTRKLVQSGDTSGAQISYTTPGIKLMQSIYQNQFTSIPSEIVPLAVEAKTSLVLSTPPSTLVGMQVLYKLWICKDLLANVEDSRHLACKKMIRHVLPVICCQLASQRFFFNAGHCCRHPCSSVQWDAVPLKQPVCHLHFQGRHSFCGPAGHHQCSGDAEQIPFHVPFWGHSCA